MMTAVRDETRARRLSFLGVLVWVVLPLAFALGVAGALVGCAGAASSDLSGGEAALSGSSGDSSGSAADASVPVLDELSYDFLYTDRDSDATYDISSATSVSWESGSVAISGQGASAVDGVVTIAQGGVYVLSGAASDAQVIVDTDDDSKVQLVLDGLDITSADGPAIYIEQAKKCFITLADGSQNSIADTRAYTLEDGEDEPDATLFSKCNLTIQGSGSLAVEGNYADAVKCKDDLAITGGNLDVTSVDDGIVGRDRLAVCGGTLAIDAGGDALKSTNENEGKGFVQIDGGDIEIISGDAGIKAENLICVSGGEMDIDSADDALHSNGDVHIAGGAFEIASGDDGIHADGALQIDGGDIDITQSYEGLEGHAIYINDGAVQLVSSDDGVNAANPDSSNSDQDAIGDDKPGDTRGASDLEQPDDGQPQRPDAGESRQLDDAAGPEHSDSVDTQQLGKPDDDKLEQGGSQLMVAQGMQEGGMGEGDDSCSIVINGGYLEIDASGDGIDSNGSLTINGGTVFVSGPVSDGDAALDYDTTATVNGGTVIAAGSSGMAQSFTNGSQAFALVRAMGSAGDPIDLIDSSGNVISSFTPTKAFESVVISSPSFADRSSCVVSVNGEIFSADAADSGESDAVARREPIADRGF